jgi:hypothetical protein
MQGVRKPLGQGLKRDRLLPERLIEAKLYRNFRHSEGTPNAWFTLIGCSRYMLYVVEQLGIGPR